MKKSEYEIDCHISKANNKAEERWQDLKNRNVEMHSIYDIREDEKQRKYFKNWLQDNDLEKLLCSSYKSNNWEEILSKSKYKVIVFNGFVSRVLKEKSNSYYIECKGADMQHFDIEAGWFGFSGLNPILPSIKKYYRYVYQPYIPGNAIRVLYLYLDHPDSKWPFTVKLHVMVENNEYISSN